LQVASEETRMAISAHVFILALELMDRVAETVGFRDLS
jgi:hypothetical protein